MDDKKSKLKTAIEEFESAYSLWIAGGRHEADDNLNASSVNLILAYKDCYKNAKGYKIHDGIKNLYSYIPKFYIDFVFNGTSENIEIIKEAEKDFKKTLNPARLFEALEKIEGKYLVWS